MREIKLRISHAGGEASLASGTRGAICHWSKGCHIYVGVTAGKASHNASNARGVTAGKMGRNCSVYKVNST